MRKFALFVFNGDPPCFIHVLLNALDMQARGDEARIVLEGASVKLVPELAKPEHPLHALWMKCREAGLVAGVCKTCGGKLGTLEAAKAAGLPLLDEMSCHPRLAAWRGKDCEVVTF